MAISGLNKQEAITLLQRQGLSTAQQAQILSSAGLLQTTQMLNASLIEEALTHTTLSTEKQKELLVSLGLADAKTKELITSNECTVAEVAQVLATKGIVGADAEAILSQLGLATANTTTTVSFSGLTTAIKANTVAMAKWLVTNPVGWCILAVGAIYGLTKAYDALTVSEKEMAEAHEESVQKAKDSVSEYEELKQELETIQQTYDDNEQKLKDLYKLRENQTITQAEEDYLKELESQNKKLEAQIKHKQTLADIEAKEAEDDAVKTLNEKTQDDSLTGHSTNGGMTVEFDKITDAEKIKQNTATINALTADLTTYEKVIQGISLSQEEVDKYTKQLTYYQEQLNGITGTSFSDDANREFYQSQIDGINKLLDGTLTYEEYEKVVSETTLSVEDLVKKNGELLEKVEPLNNAIVSTTGKNYELKKSNEEIINGAWEASSAFSNYKDSLNSTADALGEVQGSTSDDETDLWNFPELIENLDTAKEKLSVLDETYSKLFDKVDAGTDIGYEDYSSIFEAFKDIEGLDISKFINQLQEAGQDTEKVTATMQDLIGEYLNYSGILENVTEDNKELVITMLEEMGIANAEEIVLAQLSVQTEILAIQKRFATEKGHELVDATLEEINQFLKEADASDVAKQSIAQLALSKMQANNVRIDTSADIANVIALANAAGASASKIANFKNAMNQLQADEGKVLDNVGDLKKNDYAAQTKSQVENGTYNWEYKPLDVNDFKITDSSKYTPQYKGGSATQKAIDDANKASQEKAEKEKEQFEELFDFIERRLKKLQRYFDRWVSNAESVIDASETVKGLLWRYYRKASGALNQQMSTYSSAADRYMAEADKSGLSEEYKQKVRDGAIDIETITDETLAEQIKSYQEW